MVVAWSVERGGDGDGVSAGFATHEGISFEYVFGVVTLVANSSV